MPDRTPHFSLSSRAIVLGALLAGAVGWFVGFRHARHPVSTPPMEVPQLLGAGESSADPSNSLSARLDRLMEDIGDGDREIDDTDLPRLYAFAKNLTAAEFREAIAGLLSRGGGFKIDYAATLLAEYWMEIDPEAGREWFMGLNSVMQNKFSRMLSVWAADEPESALKWLEDLTDKRFNDLTQWQEINRLIDAIGPHSPERTLQLLRRLYWDSIYSEEKDSAVSMLYRSLAKESPENAIWSAMELRGEIRADALTGVATVLGRRDPAAALQWFTKITDSSLIAALYPAMAAGWAEQDPKAAVEWMAGQPDTMANKKALAKVLGMWGNSEPAVALEWVDQLPTEAERNLYYETLLHKLGFVSPDLALETVLSRFEKGLPIGNDGSAWQYYGYTNYAAALGPEKAFEVAARIPDADQNVLNNIYAVMVGSASLRDFEGAMDLIAKLPDGKRRNMTQRELVNHNDFNVRSQTVERVKQLPVTAGWDVLREEVVGRTMRNDADAAVKMARDIVDPKAEIESLKNGFRRWKNSNTSAANAWLEKTPALSPEEKAQLKKGEF